VHTAKYRQENQQKKNNHDKGRKDSTRQMQVAKITLNLSYFTPGAWEASLF